MKMSVLHKYSMDIISIILLEKHYNLLFGIFHYVKKYVVYEKLNNSNIGEAVKLWFADREKSLFKYGLISYWNVGCATNMEGLFMDIQDESMLFHFGMCQTLLI